LIHVGSSRCTFELENATVHKEVPGVAYCFDSTFRHRLVNSTSDRQLALVLSFAVRGSDMDAIAAYANCNEADVGDAGEGILEEVADGMTDGIGNVKSDGSTVGSSSVEEACSQLSLASEQRGGLPADHAVAAVEEKIYVYPDVPEKYKGDGILRDDGTPA